MSADSEPDSKPARQLSGMERSSGTPRISVLMTIYNTEEYLREAIDSLINQTFQDWELIAVENGSQDSSPAILASFKDSRIRTFALQNNIGRTSALRYAFDRTNGEFIAVLDADDMASPSRLERQVQLLDRRAKLGLVGTWADEIDSTGKVIGTFQPPGGTAALRDLLGWSNPFVHSSVMYRSALAKQVGGYPQDVTYSQDYSFILKIAQRSEVGMIESVLCKLRSGATSMTRDSSLRLIRAQEELRLLREARQMLRLSPQAARRNRHRQAVAKLKMGLALMSTSHFMTGIGYLVSAIVTNPRALIDNGFIYRHFGKRR